MDLYYYHNNPPDEMARREKSTAISHLSCNKGGEATTQTLLDVRKKVISQILSFFSSSLSVSFLSFHFLALHPVFSFLINSLLLCWIGLS